MTKLNETQQRILEKVRQEAELIAELDARAEEVCRKQKELNRFPLRVMAQEAAEAGVPIRQFGLAMGTSDFKTVKGLYPEGD